MRILRLLMGSYIAIHSFFDKNYAFTLVGALFVFQAITNTGCAACAMQTSSKIDSNDGNSIEFEEVK